MFKWKSVFLLLFCLIIAQPALTDSAAAWKNYQEGRNPLLEVGLLVVGAVIFFVLLGAINKAMEASKKKKNKSGGKRRR